MYEYYSRQNVLPTYGNFQSLSDFEQYEQQRRSLFIEKLFLPPRLFRSMQHILDLLAHGATDDVITFCCF